MEAEEEAAGDLSLSPSLNHDPAEWPVMSVPLFDSIAFRDHGLNKILSMALFQLADTS